VGQSYYLSVPVDLHGSDPLAAMYEAFLETHDRINGHRFEAPARIINLRTVHRAAGTMADASRTQPASGGRLVKSHRQVHLPGSSAAAKIPVLDRGAMPAGHLVTAPAIIEQADTTTLLTAGWSARVAPTMTLILEQDGGPHADN
jgi:N-methylhydantoinase A/oxoprolinase/acetone carboxylase beta subunit